MRLSFLGPVITLLFILILTGGALVPDVETSSSASSTSSAVSFATTAASDQRPLQVQTKEIYTPLSSRVTFDVEQFKFNFYAPLSQFNDYLTGFTQCGFADEAYGNCSPTSSARGYYHIIGSIRDEWKPSIAIFATDATGLDVAPIKTFSVNGVRMTLFASTAVFNKKITSAYQLESAWDRETKHGALFIHPYTKQTIAFIPSSEVSGEGLEKMMRSVRFVR